MTLRDDLGRWRCRDDAGVCAAGTGGTIAPPSVEAAISPDVDLQEDGVFGAGKRVPGLSAAWTVLLIAREVHRLFDQRQMIVAAAGRAGASPLLSTGTLGRRHRHRSRQGWRAALLG